MLQKFPEKILIASNNKGKIKEISELLSKIKIQTISIQDLPEFKNFIEPEENGKDFAQNSLIKAQFYAKKSGLISLADDSGLCIESLEKQPGIYSARFSLDEFGKKNFENAFKKIFLMLDKKNLDVEKNEIKAYFICNLTLFDPETDSHISFEGRVDGKITKPKGNLGFGYDPIFIKNAMSKTFGEISPQEKDKISHRAEAFLMLKNWLQSCTFYN